MPELPEVEYIRRELHERVAGQRILSVLEASHPRFAEARTAAGRGVGDVLRRGKYILLGLETVDGGPAELVLHLGMTGQLSWDVRPVDHVHLGIVFPTGTLWFRDPRRFGRAALVPAGEYSRLPTLEALGPEPDDDQFSPERVAASLCHTGPSVKARLLEQRLVAGIGNYLADEILWEVGVNPAARSMNPDKAPALRDATRRIVEASIRAGGVSERDYVHLDGSRGGFAALLNAHGRAGLPCRRCGAPLRKGRVAGRGTVWCPTCQA